MKKIVLVNMGGARSEKELKEFLFNMFLDKRIIPSNIRYILAPLIANLRYKKVWKNYQKIGESRIYDLTYNLIKKMKKYSNYDITLAMRYTKPYIESIEDNSIVIPLYPHFSYTTYESVKDKLKNKNVLVAKPFFDNIEYNKIIANKINQIDKDFHLIFSAHGLPEKLVKKFNDPYKSQIESQINILKPMLKNFKSISLAFQSRFGFSKWLTPYLSEELKKYKNEKVAIYPISFMIDNSETDLELKIEYKNLAKQIGIKEFKVIECPNDSDKIAKFLIKVADEINTSNSL